MCVGFLSLCSAAVGTHCRATQGRERGVSTGIFGPVDPRQSPGVGGHTLAAPCDPDMMLLQASTM